MPPARSSLSAWYVQRVLLFRSLTCYATLRAMFLKSQALQKYSAVLPVAPGTRSAEWWAKPPSARDIYSCRGKGWHNCLQNFRALLTE